MAEAALTPLSPLRSSTRGATPSTLSMLRKCCACFSVGLSANRIRRTPVQQEIDNRCGIPLLGHAASGNSHTIGSNRSTHDIRAKGRPARPVFTSGQRTNTLHALPSVRYDTPKT